MNIDCLRRHARNLSRLVAFLLLSACVPPTEHTQSIDAARAIAEALLEDANLPGLSLAVGLDGELVWSEGFGYADLEQRVPVTPVTRFRIGSVSKTLTAAAVGLLVERDAVDLDAPVQRYVPSFPEKRWPITLRQLAGHVAGIRDYREDEFLSARAYQTVTEGLEIFADDPLVFRPGTTYQYTTYGWSLVSAVVEGAAGEPFLAFMEREVIDALDMRHTIAEHMDAIIPNRVRYYARREDGQLRNAPYVDTSNKWAGGGYLSTPADLVRFGIDHLEARLLRPETVELLMQPQRLESGEETTYGIGWETRFDVHSRKTVGHGGGSVGGTTAFVIWPEESMVIAATTNLTEDPEIFLLAYALGEIFRPPLSTTGHSEQYLEGTFTFHLPAYDEFEELAGSIVLQRRTAGYSGSITTEVETPFGRIIWGRDEPEGVHLVATSAHGLVHLWLKNEDQGITGRWLGRGGERNLVGQELDQK